MERYTVVRRGLRDTIADGIQSAVLRHQCVLRLLIVGGEWWSRGIRVVSWDLDAL